MQARQNRLHFLRRERLKKDRGNKRSEAEHFNDLLLPVILTLCVLPFVVYLAEYDYGFGGYLWHSDNSVTQNFYNYYRERFFLVVAAFAVIILIFRLGLYKDRTKPLRIFLPFAVYSGFVILSAVFSGNPKASWFGGFVGMQGAFTLIGYGVLAFYAYQIFEQERDYRSVMRAVLVMFTLMSVAGLFQIAKHDLLNYEWMQRLTMSDALYAEYGGTVEDLFTGNNVFLTLYNPNFAAVFLVMFAALFAVFFVTAQGKKECVLYGVYLADALVLCWFTYTRAALVALAIILLLLILIRSGAEKNRQGRRSFGILLVGIVAVMAVLFLIDALGSGKYTGRLIDKKKDNRLESIVTTEAGVTVTYDGTPYRFTVENKTVEAFDATGAEIALTQTADGDYVTPFSEKCFVNALEWDGQEELIFLFNDYTLVFIKQPDSYYYATEWGKEDLMTEISHVDFHGLEYLGSGRVYIWSRVLPMLPRYLLVGSGPDTFAEVFPQNDYVGKMIYSKSTARIVEGAHNEYLMCWVQTGFLSLVSLLVFYVLFFRQTVPYFRHCELLSVKNKLGLGCLLGCAGYLVCCFFNDGTLYTTPVFYVFLGIALAASCKKAES